MNRTLLCLCWGLSLAVALGGCDAQAVGVDGSGGQAPKSLPYPPKPEAIDDLYTHSVAVAEEAVARLPDLDQALFDLAAVHRRFGFDDQAIATFRRGLQFNANRPDIYLQMGFLLSQKDDLKDALEAYRMSIVLDPKIGGARSRIGLLYLHEGRFDETIQICREEIENGTASANTHYTMAQALYLKKDHTAAIDAFTTCLSLEPNHQNALYGRSRAYRAVGKTAEADKDHAEFKKLRQEEVKALEESPKEKTSRARYLRLTAETYVDLGRTSFKLRRRDEALHYLNAALLFDPRSAVAHSVLTDVYLLEKNIDAALEHGNKALEIFPDNPDMLYTVAGFYTERQDYRKSHELLAQARLLKPKDPDVLRELARAIMNGMSKGAFRPEMAASLVPRALDCAHQAVELQRTPVHLRVLSRAYYLSGDRQQALKLLEEALRMDPHNQELQRRVQALRGQ